MSAKTSLRTQAEAAANRKNKATLSSGPWLERSSDSGSRVPSAAPGSETPRTFSSPDAAQPRTGPASSFLGLDFQFDGGQQIADRRARQGKEAPAHGLETREEDATNCFWHMRALLAAIGPP